MNRSQKIAGTICTLALVAMLIYPPFAIYREQGIKLSRGYRFIWDPPRGLPKEIIQNPSLSGSKASFPKEPKVLVELKKSGDQASIDVSTLLIQFLIIITVRVLALYALKDREK